MLGVALLLRLALEYLLDLLESFAGVGFLNLVAGLRNLDTLMLLPILVCLRFLSVLMLWALLIFVSALAEYSGKERARLLLASPIAGLIDLTDIQIAEKLMVENLSRVDPLVVVDIKYFGDQVLELGADLYIFGEPVVAALHLLQGVLHIHALERAEPELHAEQDHPDRPHIRRERVTVTANCLRGDVVGSPAALPLLVEGISQLAGESEVSQL